MQDIFTFLIAGLQLKKISLPLINIESHCMNLYATANNVYFTILMCHKITDENVKFEKYNGIR